MDIYKTSDTPFAALLITLGFHCVTKGVNSHNGRMWFGFGTEGDYSFNTPGELYELWMEGKSDYKIDLSDVRELIRVKACLIRVTKGFDNDSRLAPGKWNDYYSA